MHLDYLEHHIMHYQSTPLPLIKSFYDPLSLDGFVGKIIIFSAKLVNMPSLVDVSNHLTPHLDQLFSCTWSTNLSESLHLLLIPNRSLSLLIQLGFGGKMIICFCQCCHDQSLAHLLKPLSNTFGPFSGMDTYYPTPSLTTSLLLCYLNSGTHLVMMVKWVNHHFCT